MLLLLHVKCYIAVIPSVKLMFILSLTCCYGCLQTLYTYPENWRAFKAQIAAQYSGARLKVASSPPAFTFGQTNRSPAFLSNFPLGKVGTCSDSSLFECCLLNLYRHCIYHLLLSLGSSLPG